MIFLIPVLGLALGMVIASALPFQIPLVYVKYSALAILATMDAIFGGLRAHLQGGFLLGRFLGSFFTNAALAAFLAYLGDMLGVDIYMGAVVAFSIRLFRNLSLIREELFQKKTDTRA